MAARLNPREVKIPVKVETLGHGSAWGDGYAPERITRCAFDGARKVVRDANGDEVVAEATLLLHPSITKDAEALFTPGSRVTVTIGGRDRQSRVIATEPVMQRGRLVYVDVSVG